MKNKEKVFCPACGKAEFPRVPALDAGILDVGGRNEKCPICGTLIWIPLEGEPELVAIPVKGIPSFEPETILFDEEMKLLTAMAKGEK